MEKLDHGLTFFARGIAALLPLFILISPTFGDIAASSLAILFLLHSALAHDWQWTRERWVQLALLLALFITLRALAAPDAIALKRAAAWLRYPMFAAALTFWCLRDAGTRKQLFLASCAAVAFLIADGLIQYVFHADIFGHPRMDYGGIVRLTGPSAHPHIGSIILALLFPALLTRRFWPGLMLGLAAMLVIYLSGERMPLVLLVFGFLLAGSLLPSARNMLAAILLTGVLGAAILTAAQPTLRTRHIEGTQQQFRDGFWQSAYGQVWYSALRVAETHPLIGVGSKEFNRYCADPAYGDTTPRALHFRCPLHPHNIYLQWFAENGLIGLALYCGMIACWLATIIRSSRAWSGKPLATALIVILLVRLWPLSVGTDLFAAWAGVTLWLIPGWLLATLASERED